MNAASWYAILSTLVVSLVAFVGLFTLSFRRQWLDEMLFVLISLSAGALLGDTFFHLLPEVIEEAGVFDHRMALLVLSGIITFFLLEKFVIWHHHHTIETPEDHAKHHHHHPHSIGVMNLIGDALHNLIDGMVIAASFLISPAVGVATTLAVILHEIPQEIGDFGVLIHSGFTVRKALFFNFLSGSVAVLGALIVLFVGDHTEVILPYVVPFISGGFIYIACSDLIPELKKEIVTHRSLIQLLALIGGIVLMYLLTFLE